MRNWRKTRRSEPCRVRRHPRFWRESGSWSSGSASPHVSTQRRVTLAPGSGGPCHPTFDYTPGRDVCVTLLHFFRPNLLPPLLATCHAGWQPPVATPGSSGWWSDSNFFKTEKPLMAFQAWLVESDYGHGPSCSTTYHTVYSTVFDTFFEKRCSKVKKRLFSAYNYHTVCSTIFT